jgi:hypothetical protein
MKVCRDCGKKQSGDNYRKNRTQCLNCERAFGRNYRRTTTKAKEWVENNRDRMSELQKNHYEKNKKNIRQKESERKKNDPEFRAIKNYRKNVSCMLHGTVKSNKKLDSTHDEYAKWVEFYSEYKMDDYPEWHIDHVIPLDMLKNKIVVEEGCEEIMLMWINTRPVDAKANLRKNKYLDNKLVIEHINKLNKYLTQDKDLEQKLKDNGVIFKYRKLAQKLIDEN